MAANRTPQRLLSPQEVAEWLGVPVATLYAWRHTGGPLTGLRVGRHIRYQRQDVEDFIRQQAAAR